MPRLCKPCRTWTFPRVFALLTEPGQTIPRLSSAPGIWSKQNGLWGSEGRRISLVRIQFINWNSESGWMTFEANHPRDLERRLVVLTGWGRRDVKRLIQVLKDRKCVTIPLPKAVDRFAAESLRSFFESLGAIITLEDEYEAE